jgi:hypothetical protein
LSLAGETTSGGPFRGLRGLSPPSEGNADEDTPEKEILGKPSASVEIIALEKADATAHSLLLRNSGAAIWSWGKGPPGIPDEETPLLVDIKVVLVTSFSAKLLNIQNTP